MAKRKTPSDKVRSPRRGRPSIYSQEVAASICTHIASGRSLTSYCKQKDSPSLQTVYNWLATNEKFLELYAHAREDQADTITDESLDIADNVTGTPVLVNGVQVMVDGKALTVIDSASVAHARLKIDTRKWFASKLKPKKYGEKQTVEATGKDGAPLIPAELSELDIARRVAFVLQKAADKPTEQ